MGKRLMLGLGAFIFICIIVISFLPKQQIVEIMQGASHQELIEGNAIRSTESLNVYDEQKRKIGELVPGQAYYFEAETNEYYELQLENHRGYVLKNEVEKTTVTTDITNTDKVTNEFIRTSNQAEFYNATTNELYYIAGENRRYPILYADDTNYFVKLAGVVTKIAKQEAVIDSGIPVLMYHHLLHEEENKNYRTSSTIPVKAFEEQMAYLHDHQFETITPQDLERYLNGQQNLSTKAILITFDDGLKSNKLYAYPVMKKYQFKATNFVITSRVLDQPSPFNPDKLQFLSKGELEATADVFNFEGHTHELHALDTNKKSKVYNNTVAGLKEDFELSKTVLPKQRYFAYPFGQYNENTLIALKENGYTLAFTTKKGKVQKGDDLLKLQRIGITPDTTIKQFEYYLNNEFK